MRQFCNVTHVGRVTTDMRVPKCEQTGIYYALAQELRAQEISTRIYCGSGGGRDVGTQSIFVLHSSLLSGWRAREQSTAAKVMFCINFG